MEKGEHAIQSQEANKSATSFTTTTITTTTTAKTGTTVSLHFPGSVAIIVNEDTSEINPYSGQDMESNF